MQPSSLIFLAIIAIWAAFLLQHWVRRREHLATARSVDRFSDAMRVLERRPSPAEAGPAAPQPRSYAVSPVRPNRPEVDVLRSKPAPETSGAPVTAPRPAAVRPNRTFHALGALSGRRIRGLSFLASLALLVVVTAVVVLGVAPWWAEVVSLGLLGADFAWLRNAATKERAARRARAAQRPAAPAAAPTGRRTAGQAPKRVARPAAAARSAADAAPATDAVESVEAAGQSSSGSGTTGAREPYDGELPVDGQPQHDTVPVQWTELDPSGWQPAPVPRPTYTMKARAAERPEPQPAPVEEPAEPSVSEDELDRSLARRRAAGA